MTRGRTPDSTPVRSDVESALGVMEAGELREIVRALLLELDDRARSRVIGSLTVDRKFDPRAVSSFHRDVHFLVMVANLIGQTLQLHRYVSEDRARLMLERPTLGSGDVPWMLWRLMRWRHGA